MERHETKRPKGRKKGEDKKGTGRKSRSTCGGRKKENIKEGH